MTLLKIRTLKVHYPNKIKAIDGVSLSIEPGQTIGIIGAPGSGKTSMAKAILGLIKPTSGMISLGGKDITKAIRRNRSPHRKKLQLVPQNTNAALNPRKTIFQIIAEPLRNYSKLSKTDKKKRVDEILTLVGLSSEDAAKHPCQFSEEQRLRISIGRAIALNPKLIIIDDPISTLDTHTQAQILNLLRKLQEETGFAILLFSRDLRAPRYLCEKLAILHKSRFVEYGTTADICETPAHVYTKRLLTATPDTRPEIREQFAVSESEQDTHPDYYYKGGTEVHKLKPLSDTHYVALP
ncbi:MAG: ATP-binding cassette domain-containing protein [Defluviitaleaceae bacterium]|nr:ATP-binding cassette domain-containing protein [Defluviitaleaceae bacterium]